MRGFGSSLFLLKKALPEPPLKRSHRWPGVGLEPCLGANAPPVAIKQVVYESRTHGLKCLLGQTWLRNLGHCCMGTRGNASKLQNRGFREWEADYIEKKMVSKKLKLPYR